MSRDFKSVTLTLKKGQLDVHKEYQRVVLLQCPGAIEHMSTCNGLLRCKHALPHFPTKSCGDTCETIVSVIM
jgi:hypothetical protein